MINYDYNSLEFAEFKRYLKNSFSSRFSADACEALLPLESANDILRAQNEISEAIMISDNERFIDNDDEFYLLYQRFDDPYLSIDPVDFITVRNFLIKVEKIKAKLLTKRLKYLKDLVNSLNTLPTFASEITRCIEDTGEVKDDATPELRAIRRGMNEYRARVKRSLNDMMNSGNADKFIQDKVIVLRNGRYTLACKTNFGQYIQGIIQDKSSSGQTLYIEPTSIVSINNAMQELIIQESEEVARILFNLLSILKSSIDDITALIDNYRYLAFRMELGVFYKDKPYCFGEIAEKIALKEVHHPLLFLRKRQESIPIDFEFDAGVSAAVITGPNTGGKTAALKSIGLNHLLTFCGLPIFGVRARVIFFKQILADIGDKQSLSMDLSTFSSHMLNIKRIISEASADSLLLFDELGTGTEPREGAALAVAILKHLEAAGAKSITTTHFAEVKNYALNNPRVIFYSVDFDYETFAPRYRLLQNILGKSDPILIAQRLGFIDSIIDTATAELSKYKSSIEMQVEELNNLLAEAEHDRRILDARQTDIERREQNIGASEETLKKRLNSKELELLEETYALLQRSKRLAQEKSKSKPEEIEEDIRKTASKIEEIKSERKAVEDISVGDIIFLERYNKSAKVLSVDGESINLNMEGMRVKINKRDAVGRKVTPEKTNNVKITSNASSGNTRRELLLVGKRVEEALDILDKFIDESLLAGYESVYVIHGRGSGQLRKAVHEFLRQAPRVKRYAIAEPADGGNAITIVDF